MKNRKVFLSMEFYLIVLESGGVRKLVLDAKISR